MKAETYAKRYGGNAAQWEQVISSMNTAMPVIKHGNLCYCPICGHSLRQYRKCSYCGQKLKIN